MAWSALVIDDPLPFSEMFAISRLISKYSNRLSILRLARYESTCTRPVAAVSRLLSPELAENDSYSVHVATDHHKAQVNDMVTKFFSTFHTREQRLAHATDIFAFARQHYIRMWNWENVQLFYDVLQFELIFCGTDDMLKLLKVCSSKDPLNISIIDRLHHTHGHFDLKEIDFTTCVKLCKICVRQEPPKGFNPEVLYIALREKLLDRINGNNGDLGAEEISTALSILLRAKYFGTNMAIQVADHLSKHFHAFDPKHASVIAVTMGFSRTLNKTRDTPFFDAVSMYFMRLLQKYDKVEDRANLEYEYGFYLKGFLMLYSLTGVYDEQVCGTVADLFLGPLDQHIHTPTCLCELTTMCRSLRYYNRELLERIIQVSLSQLKHFSFLKLSRMLRAFAFLNHEHHEFLSEVTKLVLQTRSKDHSYHHVYWAIVNSSIFMNTYSTEVLETFLTNTMMEESLEQKVFYSPTLLNLLTGLAVENPHLGHTRVTDTEYGSLSHHFETLDDKYILLALSRIIDGYKKKRFSLFAANFSRALKAAVGPGYFRIEPLSLSGYNIDFEVLVGASNRAILLPFNMKRVQRDNVLKAIGITAKTHTSSFRMGESKIAVLLQDLKRSDQDTNQNSALERVDRIDRGHSLNLASDWCQYCAPQHMPSVSRRVAFELNGPLHYAVNVRDHELGKDVVKRRQLEALGWEVIYVPYYEWQHLRGGDDHINYVREKLRIL